MAANGASVGGTGQTGLSPAASEAIEDARGRDPAVAPSLSSTRDPSLTDPAIPVEASNASTSPGPRPTLGHVKISDVHPCSASPRSASATSRRSASPCPPRGFSSSSGGSGPQQGFGGFGDVGMVDASSSALDSQPGSRQSSPVGSRGHSPVRTQPPNAVAGRKRVGSHGNNHNGGLKSAPVTPTQASHQARPGSRRVSNAAAANPHQHHAASPGGAAAHAEGMTPISLSSIIAVRPSPIIGGPGPSLPSTPGGPAMTLLPPSQATATASASPSAGPASPEHGFRSLTASPVIGLSPTHHIPGTASPKAGGYEGSRSGSPLGFGSPRGSMMGLGSRSPSPTPRDDVIEGMSASETSIFERDVEHADPGSLPLTASDAVDLAIPPVLDEAVATVLSADRPHDPVASSSHLGSLSSAAAAPDGHPSLPNVVTADSSDPSSLVIEPLSEVLSTGGVSAAHPSGGWTEGPGAAAVALGGLPGGMASSAASAVGMSVSASPRASGMFGYYGQQPGGKGQSVAHAPASPPLSDHSPSQVGLQNLQASPTLSRGRSGSSGFGPSTTSTTTMHGKHPLHHQALGGPSPPPSEADETQPPPLALPGGEASPPMSVDSYPLSSSMSDPSSPRSLSPTDSAKGVLVGGGSSAMGPMALHQERGPKPDLLGGPDSPSLALSGLAMGLPSPGTLGAGGGGGPKRLSFLSYSDIINAERIEAAADRELLGPGSTVGGGGGAYGRDDMPGLLLAALGGAAPGGRDADEEEVLRYDRHDFPEDESDAGRGRLGRF